MIYKVSYVVSGGQHPGSIVNATERPRVGDRVTLGGLDVEVVEVLELMPPRGGFHFLHATCKLIEKDSQS